MVTGALWFRPEPLNSDATGTRVFETLDKLLLRTRFAHSPLLLLYARTCVDELQLSEAREAFLSVIRREPLNAEAKLGLAHVLNLEGRTSEAVVRAEQLIEEQPQHAPAYVFLSRILAGEGELARAKTLYEKALELDPDDSRASDGLEDARAGVQRIREGKKHAEEMLKQQQENENANGNINGNSNLRPRRTVNANSSSSKHPIPKRSPAKPF